MERELHTKNPKVEKFSSIDGLYVHQCFPADLQSSITLPENKIFGSSQGLHVLLSVFILIEQLFPRPAHGVCVIFS